MEVNNGAVDELNGPTWLMDYKEYILDYICKDVKPKF